MKYILLSFLFFIPQTFAAKPISISKASDLVIGQVIQGDSARVIPCGTTETANNASFNVTGTANTVYTVTLPTTASLKKTGATDLTLSSFVSYPAEGSNGLLNGSGKQTLYVGATLGSIPLSQTPGSYSGSFTINVIY